MSAGPESKVKDDIKAILKEAGAWYFMPLNKGYGRNGIPDFICCYRGYFLSIEAKAEGQEPTAWQAKEGCAIIEAGGRNWLIAAPDHEATTRAALASIDALFS